MQISSLLSKLEFLIIPEIIQLNTNMIIKVTKTMAKENGF